MNVLFRKVFAISLLFTCVLVSCSFMSEITSTPSPVVTLQPRQSPTSPVVEFTPTDSAATLEVQKLKNIVFSACLPIGPEPPGGDQIPWLLLVQRAAVYTIDPNTSLKSDELIPPPDPSSPFAYDFSLSPDGKWLAYELSGEDDNLVVVEPSDSLLTKSSQGRIFWQPEKPFRLQGWLDNESILVTIQRDPDKFVSTLIRNPFKEEEHEFFLEELPNYLDHQLGGLPGSMLFAHSNLMPDPTLKRVVYQTKNNHLMATLWDVENKKVVTSLSLFYDWAFFNDPLWSLDGRDFIIMGIDEKEHEEWFQVTQDGAIKQLTHFGGFLEDTSFGKSSRSPDGRYLGFRLYKEDGTYQNSRYLILDLKAPSIDGFCIDLRGKSNPDKAVAWSLDGMYMAITNGTIGDGSPEVILVDTEKRKAFQIAKDVEAIGWMVKP